MPTTAAAQQRRWLIIIGFLLIVTVVLLGVVIHLAMGTSSDAKDKETDKDDVLRKYGHLFVDLATFKGVKEGRTNDGKSFSMSLCLGNSTTLPDGRLSAMTISGSGMDDGLNIKPCTEKTSVLNGCCNSTVAYLKPDTATNIYGEQVKVVQYPPTYVQLFSYESCVRVAGCVSDCQCYNMLSYATAAVSNYNGKKFTTTIIQYQGCCKCINGGN